MAVKMAERDGERCGMGSNVVAVGDGTPRRLKSLARRISAGRLSVTYQQMDKNRTSTTSTSRVEKKKVLQEKEIGVRVMTKDENTSDDKQALEIDSST